MQDLQSSRSISSCLRSRWNGCRRGAGNGSLVPEETEYRETPPFQVPTQRSSPSTRRQETFESFRPRESAVSTDHRRRTCSCRYRAASAGGSILPVIRWKYHACLLGIVDLVGGDLACVHQGNVQVRPRAAAAFLEHVRGFRVVLQGGQPLVRARVVPRNGQGRGKGRARARARRTPASAGSTGPCRSPAGPARSPRSGHPRPSPAANRERKFSACGEARGQPCASEPESLTRAALSRDCGVCSGGCRARAPRADAAAGERPRPSTSSRSRGAAACAAKRQVPVEPKPPLPRAVWSIDGRAWKLTRTTGLKTSCAIRSPLLMRNSS